MASGHKKRVWIGGYYFDIDGLTTNNRVVAGIVYNESQNRYALGFWINPVTNEANRFDIDPDIRFNNEPDLIYSYSNKRFSRETKSQKDWNFAPCRIPFN